MWGIVSNRLPTMDTSSQVLPNPSAPAFPTCISSGQTPWGILSGHGHMAAFTMILADQSGKLRMAGTLSRVKLSPLVLSPTIYTSSKQTPWGPYAGRGDTAVHPMSTDFLSSRLPTADTSSQDIPNRSTPALPMYISSRPTPSGTHSGHGHTAALPVIRGCLFNRLRREVTSLQVLPNPSVPATPMCTSSR